MKKVGADVFDGIKQCCVEGFQHYSSVPKVVKKLFEIEFLNISSLRNSGKLVADINKKDMDLSISFYEQMADGRYFFLSRYLGRASYANDNRRRNLLTPGKKETINDVSEPLEIRWFDDSYIEIPIWDE